MQVKNVIAPHEFCLSKGEQKIFYWCLYSQAVPEKWNSEILYSSLRAIEQWVNFAGFVLAASVVMAKARSLYVLNLWLIIFYMH